jgi:thiol-disulfide isomerase/thioredoxin
MLLLWLVLLGSCHRKQPADNSYEVVVDIEGCTDCKVKMWLEDTTVHTATSATGRFSLQGVLARPGLYHLGYHSEADKTVSGSVSLFLPTDSVHLTITKQNIRTTFYQRPDIGSYLKNTVVFSTSPLQKEWEQYLLTRDSLWHRYFVDKAVVVGKFHDTFRSGNKALIEQWADSARSFEYRASGYWAAAADIFVRQHPASVLSLHAMLDNRNDRPSVARFRRYYRALPAALQQGFYGRQLDRHLARNEAVNQNSQRLVGQRIERLAGKTPTGQVLDAERLFRRHKLTLVEFWASWCGPCRLEMPKYYQLYKQYNRQGFGLVGVSLDTHYNQWVRAIAADSLRIPHLSELQGGDGEDIRRFGITGIPANLLVDSTGRVVAVNVLVPRLQKTLQQTL